MRLIIAYFTTLRNYLQTPKARHDLIDYVKALGLIIATTLTIAFIIKNITAVISK